MGLMILQKDSCNDILEKDNFKKTKGRKLILEILKDSTPKTAEEIFLIVKAQGQPMSLSTVYRTCEMLTQKGILLMSNFIGDGKVRYGYDSIEHRHHAVCIGCHKIIPIDDCPFGEFDKLMESKYDFDVRSHCLEIYGYCRECKLKHPDKKNDCTK